MKFDVHNYSDIINIKKPNSNHIKMESLQRAAQFAPYAALTGFDDEIVETGRIVNKKIELSEDKKSELSYKLTYLNDHIKDNIKMEITYFLPDLKKQGGSYITKISTLKRIDNVKKEIEIVDKTVIKINNIYDIRSDYFTKYEYDF